MEGYNHSSKVIPTVHMSLAAVDFPNSLRRVEGKCQNDVIYIVNSLYSVVTRHSYVGMRAFVRTRLKVGLGKDYTNEAFLFSLTVAATTDIIGSQGMCVILTTSNNPV